jgi:hypothetical protein
VHMAQNLYISECNFKIVSKMVSTVSNQDFQRLQVNIINYY